jgi:hypothetical protein
MPLRPKSQLQFDWETDCFQTEGQARDNGTQWNPGPMTSTTETKFSLTNLIHKDEIIFLGGSPQPGAHRVHSTKMGYLLLSNHPVIWHGLLISPAFDDMQPPTLPPCPLFRPQPSKFDLLGS